MVYKPAVVAAFRIYAQHGQEDATQRRGWSSYIKVIEITLFIMENHGIVFLNFCGNPAWLWLSALLSGS